VILRRAQPPKEPVLIDFGLAQRLDLALEQDALTIAGTAGYMAPEQARGTDVGPAADVHALGVILYEWLAGVRPYELDGEPPTTFGRIAAWLERARPKPLASVAQGVPPAVADLTRRMLERKPALRPAPSEIAAVCDRACSKPTASS
jgi:serine/threonine-protein kinase